MSTSGKPTSLVFAGPKCEEMAMNVCGWHNSVYVPSKFEKFPDGNDNIRLGGFSPDNIVRGADIVFVASLHSNNATMQVMHAVQVLLESFINSMTLVVPFYPFGTMERVEVEGTVATANTMARFLSQMPSCGKPMRVVMFDVHTLPNRFFFNTNAIADYHTALPLLTNMPMFKVVDYVFFPDAGAQKRFGKYFEKLGKRTGYCQKTRGENDERVIRIVGDWDFEGKHVLLVDDLVRTGGTLANSAKAIRDAGAAWVGAFCTHAAGDPEQMSRKFAWPMVPPEACSDAEGAAAQIEAATAATASLPKVLDCFYVTDSVPTVTAHLPKDNVFCVLPLCGLLAEIL